MHTKEYSPTGSILLIYITNEISAHSKILTYTSNFSISQVGASPLAASERIRLSPNLSTQFVLSTVAFTREAFFSGGFLCP